jgi:flagellin-like protein
MKGITPVVAVILLLLITISMVGFAFVWFSKVSEIATTQTEAELQNQLIVQSQKIKIESISLTRDQITIRNTGSQPIALADKISIFVQGAIAPCAVWSPPGDLSAGETSSCTSGFSCATGDTVKVSAPGNSDAIKCP